MRMRMCILNQKLSIDFCKNKFTFQEIHIFHYTPARDNFPCCTCGKDSSTPQPVRTTFRVNSHSGNGYRALSVPKEHVSSGLVAGKIRLTVVKCRCHSSFNRSDLKEAFTNLSNAFSNSMNGTISQIGMSSGSSNNDLRLNWMFLLWQLEVCAKYCLGLFQRSARRRLLNWITIRRLQFYWFLGGIQSIINCYRTRSENYFVPANGTHLTPILFVSTTKFCFWSHVERLTITGIHVRMYNGWSTRFDNIDFGTLIFQEKQQIFSNPLLSGSDCGGKIVTNHEILHFFYVFHQVYLLMRSYKWGMKSVRKVMGLTILFSVDF
ncbi:hypothetical protein Bhyg_01554 [Pseudolycoriella hygida]|uniref:Uncharacterized protein n=1 Tax=Pseudolycoriella hygida TaxID=35572 RepID=A0A9Q0S6Z1_9DIPT|nr:hypothetical protein Bhyg_01554 [Pseudolycoriella hygida]